MYLVCQQPCKTDEKLSDYNFPGNILALFQQVPNEISGTHSDIGSPEDKDWLTDRHFRSVSKTNYAVLMLTADMNFGHFVLQFLSGLAISYETTIRKLRDGSNWWRHNQYLRYCGWSASVSCKYWDSRRVLVVPLYCEMWGNWRCREWKNEAIELSFCNRPTLYINPALSKLYSICLCCVGATWMFHTRYKKLVNEITLQIDLYLISHCYSSSTKYFTFLPHVSSNVPSYLGCFQDGTCLPTSRMQSLFQ